MECRSSQTERLKFDDHEQAVTHLAVSPNARYAVSASDDHVVLIWDLQKKCLLAKLQGFADEIIDVHFMSKRETSTRSSLLHRAHSHTS